jgi:beta-glucosidase-like glycosyl hydrolase/CubicO group peptidase (beta-lactamase class C family)
MKKKFIINFLTFFLIYFLLKTNISFGEKTSVICKNNPPFIADIYYKWADSVLTSMTLEEKIGQLFMIDAYSAKDNTDKEKIIKYITKYKIGGLIFFKGSPKRQAILTNLYQSLSKIPLLIGIDAEYGLAMRLDSTIRYPDQMMLAAIDDDKLIYEMGRDIALQCKRLGIHINFAPVIDINNNPKNPVINIRSFGENKFKVADFGYAYMSGLQDNGILAVGKHFPGHGDTDKDSHFELPFLNQSYKRIDTLELYPFKKLISNNIGGIMTAHLYVPSIDSEKNLPASLSEKVIIGLLKDSLKFKGIVFSDALNMKGASFYGDKGKVEERAFMAGNDILLFPNDIENAIERLIKDVKQCIIPIDTINNRCRKILALKKWLNADKFTPIDTTNLYEDLNMPAYQYLKNQLIEKSITLISNKDSIIPIKDLENHRIAAISIGDGLNNDFHEYLSYYNNIKTFAIDKKNSNINFGSYIDSLYDYDIVIISIMQPDRKVENNFGFIKEAIDFINKIKIEKKLILCVFTNPYSLTVIDDLDKIYSVIISYNDNPEIQKYTAQLIFGGINASGILPVTISNNYKEGNGIKTNEKIRLKFGMPEDLGINTKRLNSIDTIINYAIKQNVFPGCQILCAKDGIVFYNKSFGNYTYTDENKIKNNSLYDIASITKITTTVPALMKLYEKKQIKLDSKLKDFLPELSSTNKGNILIRDILIHQAGLKPWIPFYTMLYDPLFPNDVLFSKELSVNYPYYITDKIYLNKNFTFKKQFVTNTPDSVFSIKVADGIYINKIVKDSIFKIIDKSELLPGTSYVYSDLGYFYLYRIIEKITNKPFNSYLEDEIYKPAGVSRFTFLPVQRFCKSEIVPTEYDRIFRQQLIQGYVHDQAAALLGGVCGHAGIFANSISLATIMQIYLQKGTYGGKQFFLPETIDLFTTAPSVSKNGKRALGFEKKGLNGNGNSYLSQLAPPESYGHTGFTGCIAWVDPVNKMIFIFLSNRVYPDANNNKINELKIRALIQDEFYKAILNK